MAWRDLIFLKAAQLEKCPRLPTILSGLKAPSFFPSPRHCRRSPGKTWGGAFPGAVTGSDASISRDERRACLGGPEPASERWWSLRTLALPPHGAAPGAAAGRGRALGNAGAAGHRRLRKRLPVPASGEEPRWVLVGASVERSDCQCVKHCR